MREGIVMAECLVMALLADCLPMSALLALAAVMFLTAWGTGLLA